MLEVEEEAVPVTEVVMGVVDVVEEAAAEVEVMTMTTTTKMITTKTPHLRL